MTRILFTTIPIAGHVRPALPLARELVSAGHEVVWYSGRKFQGLIENVGAKFLPTNADLDFDDEEFDVLHDMTDRKPGLSGLRAMVLELFIRPIPAYTADLGPLFDEIEPEVVVADHCFMAGPLLARQRGIGSVVYTVGPLSLSSKDTAPFGMGLPPASTWLGRWRNGILNWALRAIIFRRAQREVTEAVESLGTKAFPGFFMDWMAEIADRYVHASISELEYPRTDLPGKVEFIGTMVPSGVDSWTPPDWWPDVEKARAEGRRVVVVTQGTAATEPNQLILPAIQALASEDVLLIATTGDLDPAELMPEAQRPANLRVERFVPLTELLPMTDLLITNGGFGGVQMSLSFGVPLVVAGMSEDKMEVNARVAWSGTGVSLKTYRPTARHIAAAVHRIFTEPAFARRAEAMRKSYARYPCAPGGAAIVLETAAARLETTATEGSL